MGEKLKDRLQMVAEKSERLSEVEAAFVAGMMEGMCKAKDMEPTADKESRHDG